MSYEGEERVALNLHYHIHLKPLNFEINPISHFLALLGAHLILHVSRIRVNYVQRDNF
jgi:hypothetical protein